MKKSMKWLKMASALLITLFQFNTNMLSLFAEEQTEHVKDFSLTVFNKETGAALDEAVTIAMETPLSFAIDASIENTKEVETIFDFTFNGDFDIAPTSNKLVDEQQNVIGTYEMIDHQLSLTIQPGVAATISLAFDGGLKADATSAKLAIQFLGRTIDYSFLLAQPEIVLDENGVTDDQEIISNLPAASSPRAVIPQETAIITSIAITDRDGNPFTPENPAQLDGGANIYFKWEIPNNVRVKNGDIFSFDLPKEFMMYNNVSGLLDGYGRYDIDTDGHIILTFNELAENSDDVHGTLEVHTFLNKSTIDGSTEQEIEFPVSGGIDVPIIISPEGGSAIVKHGAIDAGYNGKIATWTIDMNTTLTPIEKPIVKDTLPPGMAYVEETIEIYELLVDVKGNVTQGDLISSDHYYFTYDSSEVKVVFSEKTTKAFRIIFDTEITNPDDHEGTVTFKNTVGLYDDLEKLGTGSASVQTKYGKPLEKVPHYDPQSQSFEWEIKYNYNEATIQKDNAWIVDEFDDSFDLLVSPVVYEVSIDANGKETVSPTPIPATQYTVSPKDSIGKHGFKLTFNQDINHAYLIKYTIKSNTIIDENGTVTNEVNTGSGHSTTVGGKYQQHGVVKSLEHSIIGDEYLKWKVTLNGDHHEVKNLVVNDRFPNENLKIMLDTVVLVDDQTGETLILDQDYTAVLIDNDDQVGFTISFIGTYAVTDHSFTMRYGTYYKPSGSGDDKFVNSIDIDWTGHNDEAHEGGDTEEFVPPVQMKDNGEKLANYNPTTKEITWTIHANYNEDYLVDATIEDTILQDMKYVDGSAEVFEYTITDDGRVIEGDLLSTDKFTLTEPTTANNKVLVELKLSDREKVGLRFKTTFVGEIIDEKVYENEATFKNNGQDYPYDATVDVPNGGNFISKSGKQNGDEFQWEIPVNYSRSTLEDVVVSDEPNSAHVFMENTLHIFETLIDDKGQTSVNKDKELKKGVDYQLTVIEDEQTGVRSFSVAFIGDYKTISEGLFMTYASKIVGVENEEATNKVELSGKNITTITHDYEAEVIIKASGGIGTGTGKTGTFHIKKTDALTSDALAGAKFELYLADGKTLARTGTTDASGTLDFLTMRKGTYILKEVDAPKGYLISPQLLKGVRVELDYEDAQAGSVKVIELEIENEPTRVEIIKVDGQDGTKLQGAEFEVIKDYGGTAEAVVATSTTDATGRIIFTHLAPGFYALRETRAPDGYILNSKVQMFYLSGSSHFAGEISVSMTRQNFKGRAQLRKVNTMGSPLKGAEFKVVDASGQTVASNLQSTMLGVVTVDQLAPGTYYFEETKAPDGYILDTRQHVFTIADSFEGLPTVNREAGNVVNAQGSIAFTKINEAGVPLALAEFTLLDAAGTELRTDIISSDDGIVEIDGLAPGDYQLIETKAPVGYVLNTTVIPFTISATTDADVIVQQLPDFINYTGRAVLVKTDMAGKALDGALFNLVDADDAIVKNNLVSNQKGHIEISNLAPGDYYLKEIQAPTGYQLSKQIVTITIPKTFEGALPLFDLGTFVNTKVPNVSGEKLPTTGEPINEWTTLGFTFTTLGLLGFYLHRKLKQ